MKKILSSFFILYCQFSFSQNPFTKFVESKKVQFAIVTNDTFHFSNPNLSFLFRDSFNKGKIKAGIIPEGENISKIIYSSKEAIINRIAPNRESKVMDAEGNI